jgi:hypothetical protein
MGGVGGDLRRGISAFGGGAGGVRRGRVTALSAMQPYIRSTSTHQILIA